MEQRELIRLAYLEDLPSGDLTSDNLNIQNHSGLVRLVAKEDLVLSGKSIFAECCKYMDPSVQIDWNFFDSDLILTIYVVIMLEEGL